MSNYPNVSKHFTLYDFRIYWPDRIRESDRLVVTPLEEHIPVISRFCENYLEPVWEKWGKVTIVDAIHTEWLLDKKHNTVSRHLMMWMEEGVMAVDFRVADMRGCFMWLGKYIRSRSYRTGFTKPTCPTWEGEDLSGTLLRRKKYIHIDNSGFNHMHSVYSTRHGNRPGLRKKPR